MDAMREEIQCRIGDDVYGSDDHKVGTVIAFDANYVTVEHGLLRKSHYFIPRNALNAASGGRVYLNVTKHEITERGWDAPPPVLTEADRMATSE